MDTSPLRQLHSGQPAYRSYVSVELPFCVAPTATDEQSAAQRAEVEAYLPPHELGPCLDDFPVSGKGWKDNRGKRRGATATARALARSPATTANNDDYSASSCSGDDGNHSSGDSNASDCSSDESDDESARVKAGGRASGNAPLSLRMRSVEEYNTDPIFTCWRGTDWGDKAATTATATPSEGVHSPSGGGGGRRAQRRREVFPSTVPQMLLSGYYRNDLLVRVTTTRQVRRLRDAVTGAVVEETTLPPSKKERVEVVGVVSREIEMARPVDFTFGIFGDRECAEAPGLCSRDLFPPMRYLSGKAPFEARYEMGKEANGSVLRHHKQVSSLLASGPGVQVKREGANHIDGGNDDSAEDEEEPSQWVMMDFVNPLVVAPNDPKYPPEQLERQVAFLERIGSSCDGTSDSDPPEVRVAARLLAARPVWAARDLSEAMLQSGECPRVYFNKQVMNCLTYLIRTGPFNRLRIRLGYDPHANSSSVIYQRMIIRLARRSQVGVQLRDLARSAHMQAAVDTVLARKREEIAAYKKATADVCPGPCKRTLTDVLCHVALGGFLYLPFQFVDVLDDRVFAEIIAGVPPMENMPAPKRVTSSGWLTEESWSRASNHYVTVLEEFLSSEIVPLIRVFRKASGEEGEGGEASVRNDGSAAPQADPQRRVKKKRDGSHSDDGDDSGNISSNASMAISSLSASEMDEESE